MPHIPESDLADLLTRLLVASGRNADARAAAVAGFQRLCEDVRRWNDELLAVLRSYPGFAHSGAHAEYDAFLDQVAACRDALNDADGRTDSIATMLKNARNTADFLWQLAAEAGPYLQRRPRVMDTIQTYDAACAMAWNELRHKARTAGIVLPDASRTVAA